MRKKIIVGTLSIDMIIALSLFVISFISYIVLGNDWIRDVVNLVLGTIIGALKVSLTHSDIKEDPVNKTESNTIDEIKNEKQDTK